MYDLNNYIFNRDKCWIKSTCPFYNDEEECHGACDFYFPFYHLVNLARIPEPMQYQDFHKLNAGKDKNEYERLEEIRMDIENWVKEGNNLYLFSDTFGNGKTTWAVRLMLKYFSQIYLYNGDKCRGLFLNMDDLIFEMKRNITDHDYNFNEMLKLIPEVDLVIWDDFGVQRLSDYAYEPVYVWINQRIMNNKANIFTSNVIDDELFRNVGGRIGDRVLRTSEIIEFINPSQRSSTRRREGK